MKNVVEPTLSTRLVLGGIAGFVATMAMTSAMTRMHRRLPVHERYPLPPREITAQVMESSGEVVRDTAMATHFVYGGACGALLAATRPHAGVTTGALAGVAIWAGSYLGWAPALRILKPAWEHPGRRNSLMIAAHLVWGSATSLATRELLLARRTILNDGPIRDAAVGQARRNNRTHGALGR